MGVSGIFSSCIRGFGVHLELRRETQVSSLVETGEMGLHSICGWDLRVPLELWFETWGSSRVAADDSELLLSCAGYSGFVSSCSSGLRLPLSHGRELGVPLELRRLLIVPPKL